MPLPSGKLFKQYFYPVTYIVKYLFYLHGKESGNLVSDNNFMNKKTLTMTGSTYRDGVTQRISIDNKQTINNSIRTLQPLYCKHHGWFIAIFDSKGLYLYERCLSTLSVGSWQLMTLNTSLPPFPPCEKLLQKQV